MIVVGATTCDWKLASEPTGVNLSWLATADQLEADAAQAGHELRWFLAAESEWLLDGCWVDLLDTLERRPRYAHWRFTLDDHAPYSGPNRLVRICTGRNLIVEYAQREHADWILYLDTDIEPPPDLVSKLLALDYPIVGGDVPAYCLHGEPDGRFGFPVEQHWNTAGCLLVRRDLFSRLRWRHDFDVEMTDDPCYAADAEALGWPTLVRHDIGAHHRGKLVPVEQR